MTKKFNETNFTEAELGKLITLTVMTEGKGSMLAQKLYTLYVKSFGRDIGREMQIGLETPCTEAKFAGFFRAIIELDHDLKADKASDFATRAHDSYNKACMALHPELLDALFEYGYSKGKKEVSH